jgi:hypothetical protein
MKRTTDFVLTEMRVKGATLHLSFENGCGVWFLSNDKRPLADAVGLSVARDLHVAGVGDALFEGAPCQTFRYVHEKEKHMSPKFYRSQRRDP